MGKPCAQRPYAARCQGQLEGWPATPVPIFEQGGEGRLWRPGAGGTLADPPAGSLLRARLSMTPEEHRAFWRNVQFTVDKDVVRTDRSNQFFRGEGNPNVESMRYHLPGQQGSFPTGFHSRLPPRSLRSQLTLWEVDQPQKLLQGSRIFLLGSVPQNQRALSYFRQCQWAPYCPNDSGEGLEAPPKGTSKGPAP